MCCLYFGLLTLTNGQAQYVRSARGASFRQALIQKPSSLSWAFLCLLFSDFSIAKVFHTTGSALLFE